MTNPLEGHPHPRARMQGPRSGLPVTGMGTGATDLPYAPSSGGGRKVAAVVAALVAVGALVGGGIFLATGSDDAGSDQQARAEAPAPTTTVAPEAATDATGASDTTDASASTSAGSDGSDGEASGDDAPEPGEIKVSSTSIDRPGQSSDQADETGGQGDSGESTDEDGAASDPSVPVSELPRHEAVYRNGRLILQGTVPSQEIADRFRDEAAAVIGAENVDVRYVIDPRVPEPTDGRVRVDEDFLFDTGSAAIDPAYESLMQLGVAVLRINPHARMRIVGHTDSTGSDEVNDRLSQARADALKRYLVSEGIEASRVTAVGKGPDEPVASNETAAGRAQNRRIEVELLDLLAE